MCFFFFFSSRRRHTRLVSDWSSDVCSSDLSAPGRSRRVQTPVGTGGAADRSGLGGAPALEVSQAVLPRRSEERRVGKECRSGWWWYDVKENEELSDKSCASVRMHEREETS